jgi:DNA polymerase elongation subunit (family B)
MMRRMFVDIETLPPDQTSSDASLQEELASGSDEDFRRLALDGDYGRVLTIGLIIERDDKIIHKGLLGRERQTMLFHLDEARTLRGFWKLLKGFNPHRDLIVVHNVLDFDLPFLYKRSVIHRVRPQSNCLSRDTARSRSLTPCSSGTSGRRAGSSPSTGWPRCWGLRVRRGRELMTVACMRNSALGVTGRSPTTACAMSSWCARFTTG